MKKTLSLILALVMVLGMAACGQSAAPAAPAPAASAAPAPAEPAAAPAEPAAEPLVLRYASVYTQSSTYGQAMEKFKSIVEEKSNGSMIIDCFYDAALGAESDMIQSQHSR